MRPNDGSVIRFLMASALAACTSIAVVEVGERMLPMAIGWVHVIVVSISYFAAARLNFEMQRRWVFGSDEPSTGGYSAFALFVLVNGTMSLLVGAVSVALMRWPEFRATFDRLAMATSLVAGAAVVAPMSFVVVRRLVRRDSGALAMSKMSRRESMDGAIGSARESRGMVSHFECRKTSSGIGEC